MKFGYTILYVDDVEATIAFYVKAFGMTVKMLHKSDDGSAYGELDTGATTLSFVGQNFIASQLPVPVQAAGVQNAAPPFEIAFVTDDVAGAFERAVAAGAVAVEAPASKPWGQIVSYVRDLNGFLVEIC